jgi:hypothetical protein
MRYFSPVIKGFTFILKIEAFCNASFQTKLNFSRREQNVRMMKENRVLGTEAAPVLLVVRVLVLEIDFLLWIVVSFCC